MKGLSLKDESGLTLAEILVAAAVVMIGLAALLHAFPLATHGMETGRRGSTAVFLAEQKLEQIKAFSLSTGAQGFDNFPPNCNPCPTVSQGATPPFNSETLGTGPDGILGYPEYSRTVIVQNGPAANTRLVQVLVNYRRVTRTGVFTNLAAGANQFSVQTLIARR